MAKVSGLEADDLDIILSDINPSRGNRAALNACREMIDDPYGWLWIWGGPGNAKSDMLMAVVNELNRGGRMAVYIKFSKLIEYMRDVYKLRKRFKAASDPDDVYATYEARFQRMLNIPVLAIDEMDKIRFTEFAEEFRFDFLDDRWRQGVRGTTITLFASNDNPNTLPEPIWDRVRDGRFKVIENTQPSARPVMRR